MFINSCERRKSHNFQNFSQLETLSNFILKPCPIRVVVELLLKEVVDRVPDVAAEPTVAVARTVQARNGPQVANAALIAPATRATVAPLELRPPMAVVELDASAILRHALVVLPGKLDREGECHSWPQIVTH